ncbi:MAG: alpha/beta hydrolase family protein, partial [Isosphaeraceae bacterium]
MRSTCAGAALCLLTLWNLGEVEGQRYKPPSELHGDRMIQAYLAREADALESTFPADVTSAEDWNAGRPQALREYFDMLGLDPFPPRGDLKPTVTGVLERDGYVVEKLHYQSIPGLYVTANLYRPTTIEPGRRLPAVLYVCGHSMMGRDGNKTAYQSHGIWLARHGYVCLMVDTLQLGEINATHHGTYSEGRWWWHSRGYSSAAIECWNGIRGVDYLVSRAEVDPERVGVTGISGGGAATFWIAAADDRVKVAVPVSGMADLKSYVTDGVVNGHCDCMFLYNTYRWPWTRIAGLIAPRPLLFVNSDDDAIFPMDANERVIARLERLYSRFGAGDRVDAVVSVGGHAYRQDIRQSAFRFLNTYLKADARPVDDSEVDVVQTRGDEKSYPIPPSQLRAFPSAFPSDQINTSVDQVFVPAVSVSLPADGEFPAWRKTLVESLRRQTFRPFPDRVPATHLPDVAKGRPTSIVTEDGIESTITLVVAPAETDRVDHVFLLVSLDDSDQGETDPRPQVARADTLYRLQPRGVGPTRWTRRNPPNYVERAHVLIGRTVDGGRVWDVAATARGLRQKHGEGVTIHVIGRGAAGALAAHAALIEPSIDAITAVAPPSSYMDPGAPALLNVLRVLDLPEAFGL